MSSWITEVRNLMPAECKSQSCRDQQCYLKVSNLPKNDRYLTRIDGCESLFPTRIEEKRKKCDFLLFVEFGSNQRRRLVVPIELKSGKVKGPDLDGIQAQLQTGADIAVEKVDTEGVSLRPILGCRELPVPALKKLRDPKTMIRFGSKKHHIKPLTCGDHIEQALREGRAA